MISSFAHRTTDPEISDTPFQKKLRALPLIPKAYPHDL
jgi:hypothetical protein